MDKEDEIIQEETTQRGRKPHVFAFETNITNTLNQAMQDLKAEEMQIKKFEYDPEIRKLQLKQLKKVVKDLSKIYMKCI